MQSVSLSFISGNITVSSKGRALDTKSAREQEKDWDETDDFSERAGLGINREIKSRVCSVVEWSSLAEMSNTFATNRKLSSFPPMNLRGDPVL